MAVEGTKIKEMMEGKTLEKDNIKKMYDMVQNASEPEEKKKVMKHSVFFIGQLPLKENHIVDLEQTRRIVNGSVPFAEVDTYMDYLLKGLSTQKLLLEKEDGSYEVNTKYEKSVIKVRKIARAFQLEKEKALEAGIPKAKKMYQMGTKYYQSLSVHHCLIPLLPFWESLKQNNHIPSHNPLLLLLLMFHLH